MVLYDSAFYPSTSLLPSTSAIYFPRLRDIKNISKVRVFFDYFTSRTGGTKPEILVFGGGNTTNRCQEIDLL